MSQRSTTGTRSQTDALDSLPAWPLLNFSRRHVWNFFRCERTRFLKGQSLTSILALHPCTRAPLPLHSQKRKHVQSRPIDQQLLRQSGSGKMLPATRATRARKPRPLRPPVVPGPNGRAAKPGLLPKFIPVETGLMPDATDALLLHPQRKVPARAARHLRHRHLLRRRTSRQR